MKTYVNAQGFCIIGKVKELSRQLAKYKDRYVTVIDLIKNQLN